MANVECAISGDATREIDVPGSVLTMRFMAECVDKIGGKSPQIILKDAPDLARTAASVAAGIFGNRGEVCSAGSRILVAREVHDEFCAHQDRVLGHVSVAVDEGASAIVSGSSHTDSPAT